MENVITNNVVAPCDGTANPAAAMHERSLFELLIRGDLQEVNRRLLEQPLAPLSACTSIRVIPCA